jgi:hypothetical protein
VATLARETLELVVGACRSAGADPLVLPARDPRRTRVTVDRAHRDSVIEAVRATSSEHQLLVRHGRGRRPVDEMPIEALRGRQVALFRTLVLEPGGGAVLGEEHGCDLEFHGPEEPSETIALTLGNQITERLPSERARPATVDVLGGRFPTWEPFAVSGVAETVEFPIDVVYTWVDGADPAWLERNRRHAGDRELNEQAANRSRYEDRGELRYSLRSLHLHAEWVNHIWIVTDDQVPSWLDTDRPGLTVVDHRDIFADPDALPTFNSHAIESQLHHIPDLAEHFLYLNDDVYLGRWVRPQLFFLGNGTPRFFPSQHQIDLGPATLDDSPVMAAAKTGRDLLQQRFGSTVTQKLKHVPHSLRRSILAQIEREFPDELDRTMRSRFRAPTDVSLTSAFAHHYAFLSERAVPADLRYRYVELVEPDLEGWLAYLHAQRPLDVFCINDTVGTDEQIEARTPLLQRFLAAYFPLPSPFER